jgi:superfamily II DNA or RNA helicase
MELPPLRDYQRELVDKIKAAFLVHRRVLAVAPTGAGKTIVFAHIARNAAETGRKILILAHRLEIIEQIRQVVGDHDGNIEYSTVQSIHKVQTIPDLIIIDEAHHAVNNSYLQYLMQVENALILGVTATPQRLDGKGLKDVFETMVLGPTVQELIAKGYLSPYRYLAPPSPFDKAKLRMIGGDYGKQEIDRIIRLTPLFGDTILHYRKFLDGKRVLVFCPTVLLCYDIAEAYNKADIPAAVLEGNMSFEDRRVILNRFRDGEIKAIMSCDLIGEGLDIPAVEGIQMLRPTKSTSIFLQQVGRALRPSPGKKEAIILDHAANVFRHGMPDEERVWTLNGYTLSAVRIKRCYGCYKVFDSREPITCPLQDPPPECILKDEKAGFEIHNRFNVRDNKKVMTEIVEGDLVDFCKERSNVKLKGDELRQAIRKAKTIDELLDLAYRQGYDPRWAYILFAIRHKRPLPYRKAR